MHQQTQPPSVHPGALAASDPVYQSCILFALCDPSFFVQPFQHLCKQFPMYYSLHPKKTRIVPPFPFSFLSFFLSRLFFPVWSMADDTCRVVFSCYCCCCCCSVTKLCPTLCDPTDCSMPGLPVPHYLPEFAQVHFH